jgi:hypothetical protein
VGGGAEVAVCWHASGELTHVKIVKRRRRSADRRLLESKQMLDVIFLAVGLGFFALSIGYVYACDRL